MKAPSLLRLYKVPERTAGQAAEQMEMWQPAEVTDDYLSSPPPLPLKSLHPSSVKQLLCLHHPTLATSSLPPLLFPLHLPKLMFLHAHARVPKSTVPFLTSEINKMILKKWTQLQIGCSLFSNLFSFILCSNFISTLQYNNNNHNNSNYYY